MMILEDGASVVMELQCDRACEGAEIQTGAIVAATTAGFNVTAPVKARKSRSDGARWIAIVASM